MSVHFVNMVTHLAAFRRHRRFYGAESSRDQVGHRQPVRAFIAQPDPSKSAQQLDVWMEHMDGAELTGFSLGKSDPNDSTQIASAEGRLVFEGTASVGLRPGEMTTMEALTALACTRF